MCTRGRDCCRGWAADEHGPAAGQSLAGPRKLVFRQLLKIKFLSLKQKLQPLKDVSVGHKFSWLDCSHVRLLHVFEEEEEEEEEEKEEEEVVGGGTWAKCSWTNLSGSNPLHWGQDLPVGSLIFSCFITY